MKHFDLLASFIAVTGSLGCVYAGRVDLAQYMALLAIWTVIPVPKGKE